ncbi:MAG: methyltransferase domain-containing protein [Infirmifilum sp.]
MPSSRSLLVSAFLRLAVSTLTAASGHLCRGGLPREYVGVGIEPGLFVDVLAPAEGLVERFGEDSFDVVISTELLEHVREWRLAVSNMKRVLKPGALST